MIIMKNLTALYFKTIKFSGTHLISLLLMTLILITFSGCNKDQLITKEGSKVFVEGLVLEDSNGNASQDKKVILKHIYSGCFGGGILSEETVLTNKNGHFSFVYHEAVNDGSTTIYSYSLTVSNSTICITNPSGNLKLYPNDTLMNAIINLKFKKRYTSLDTLYCQFKPSPKGLVEKSVQIQYFVGPFRDTTLILKNLRIGNSNNIDKGKYHCGTFKWSIGKLRLNSYYTGKDGYFYLDHEPYAVNDIFDYTADPIK
jgi:hypothetical protein